MRKQTNFFYRMLSDSKSGDISSRRVIGVIGFFSLVIMMFVNSLYPKTIAPNEHLISALEYIIIACIFGTTADKFSRNYKQPESEEK